MIKKIINYIKFLFTCALIPFVVFLIALLAVICSICEAIGIYLDKWLARIGEKL
jgi:hypothetical protein